MTNKSFPPATIIPHGFFINRPVAVTEDGHNLYPSFAKAPPTREQVIARVRDEIDLAGVDSVQGRLLTETLERLTGRYIPQPTADLDLLADLLIQYATDQVEDEFGNTVDVSGILALFDGAVETDCLGTGFRNKNFRRVDRTLAGWVPNADLNNAHNVEAFEQAFERGATDWSGANSDGHPVDVDGAYDPDNHGFFDKFGTSESLGYSECSDDFFTHNTTGEEQWG